jgi:hypothetical protein
MPTHMIIHKTDGSLTGRMPQHVIKNYLKGFAQGSRLTNLSQALNQAFDGGGKATGAKKFNGKPILHASAGRPGVSSVTLFYYEQAGTFYLVAMGEHASASSYKIRDFGPQSGTFKTGTTVSI